MGGRDSKHISVSKHIFAQILEISQKSIFDQNLRLRCLFFELENREAVFGFFFEFFFEGHRKSLNIFLKVENKEKQREKANKESNFLRHLAAPENIDLWYFAMKI